MNEEENVTKQIHVVECSRLDGTEVVDQKEGEESRRQQLGGKSSIGHTIECGVLVLCGQCRSLMTEIGLIWVLALQVLQLTPHSHSHVEHRSRLRHRVGHRQRLRAVRPRLLQVVLCGEGDGVALHAHQLTVKEKCHDNVLNGSL